MQATDTPSIIHRYFMIKNSSFQTCNTLNIKALELYYNIKKWNIELDTLLNNSLEMEQNNVKPADGKLGIMVVGCGAVSTTFMTGVLMARK